MENLPIQPEAGSTGNDSLAALAAQANQLDAERAAAQFAASAPPEQPQASLAEMKQQAAVEEFVAGQEEADLSGLLQLLAAVVTPISPSLATVYTPDTCDKIAAAAIPVMRKRGWSLDGVAGKNGAELTLVITLLPVALATYEAVMHDIEARAQQPEEERSWLSRWWGRVTA